MPSNPPPTRVTVQRLDAPHEPGASFIGPSLPPPPPAADRMREFVGMLYVLTPRTFVSHCLLAANVLMFLWMVLHGVKWSDPTTQSLLRFGADYGPLTTAYGQWWRLLTATFIHIGLVHLLMNMYALWAVGPFVERLLGNVGLGVAYLISGLAGSVASVWHNPMVLGAGASGAIFGLFGALAGFVILRRDSIPHEALRGLMRSVIIFVGYSVAFGMMQPHVDQAAHLGGLAGGFACGLMLSQPLGPTAIAGRRFRNAMTLFIGLGVLVMLASRLPRDYFKEAFRRMKSIEDRAQPDLKQNDAGKITNTALAKVLQERILPPWISTRELLKAPQATPEQATKAALLDSYMFARQREWEQEVELSHHDNPTARRVQLQLRALADFLQSRLRLIDPG